MKAKLVVFSLCALFGLSLLTVRLRTREALLQYEIAELETLEDLLLERIEFLKSEVEERTGVKGLLDSAVDLGIDLYMTDGDGKKIALLPKADEDLTLE